MIVDVRKLEGQCLEIMFLNMHTHKARKRENSEELSSFNTKRLFQGQLCACAILVPVSGKEEFTCRTKVERACRSLADMPFRPGCCYGIPASTLPLTLAEFLHLFCVICAANNQGSRGTRFGGAYMEATSGFALLWRVAAVRANSLKYVTSIRMQNGKYCELRKQFVKIFLVFNLDFLSGSC